MKNQLLILRYLPFVLLILSFGCQTKQLEDSSTLKEDILRWNFPLPRTHTGALLGNGTQGLMVWGEGRQLNITIGRAGFWDHRGGNDFSARTNYKKVKSLLQKGDLEGLKTAFDIPKKRRPTAYRPHQLGGGRMEVTLPEGWTIKYADLHFKEGYISIKIENQSGRKLNLKLQQATYQELTLLELPDDIREKISLRLVPSWEHIKELVSPTGVTAPETWEPQNQKRNSWCFYANAA
ncbi:MAG: hypothetical protein AAFO07_13705 [Bacteroidota bacterium]